MNKQSITNISAPVVDSLGACLAVLLMRVWLGIRSFQAGVEKFAGVKVIEEPTEIDGEANEQGLTTVTNLKVYSFEDYQGVPSALYGKLSQEPLMNPAMLDIYNFILGPALLVLGIMLLTGIATRFSLFFMGLLYTSLTFGLILLNQPSGIAWLATHILVIVLMLLFAHHNRFEISSLLKRQLKQENTTNNLQEVASK